VGLLYFLLGVVAGLAVAPFFLYWLIVRFDGEDRARDLL
jgi:hypothetical protein